jgi:hypothetical protein
MTREWTVRGSQSFSSSSFPRVGLCFSEDFVFFFRSGTTCSGGGEPIRSRASALTAVTARNGFLFLLRAIVSPEASVAQPGFPASYSVE